MRSAVVAGGGDGTINEVFASAYGVGLPPQCSLGVLPLGTGVLHVAGNSTTNTSTSVGAGLVVLAGLAFNLVPLCTPGRSFASLLKGALVIAIIFVVVTLIALGSALLYAAYLKAD